MAALNVGLGNQYGYDRYGYDPYYAGYGYNSGYGYNPYGWYNGYYYPGSGYWVYDPDGNPNPITGEQRSYWGNVIAKARAARGGQRWRRRSRPRRIGAGSASRAVCLHRLLPAGHCASACSSSEPSAMSPASSGSRPGLSAWKRASRKSSSGARRARRRAAARETNRSMKRVPGSNAPAPFHPTLLSSGPSLMWPYSPAIPFSSSTSAAR